MNFKLLTRKHSILYNIYDAIQGAKFAYGDTDDFISPELPVAFYNLAMKLSSAPISSGHDKFLQSIHFLIDISAPRYWWSEMDTYRIGISKQSESTMHTILKTNLTLDNFELDKTYKIENYILSFIDYVNDIKLQEQLSELEKLRLIKQSLPESFIQKRRVSMNYAVVKTINSQRKTHKLKEWKEFLEYLKINLPYSEFCFGKDK